MDGHKNLAITTVATAPSPADSGTSLVVASGHGARFPTPPFNATVWPAYVIADPSNAEIVRVTGRSTDTLTIERAQEGTNARTILVSDQIAATITAKTIEDLEATLLTGWTHDAATWEYVSASSFKISGVDVTARFAKGTRIRFKQGGDYKYAVVVGVSFSTDTTVTIAVNNDYTIANATITDNDYSYQASPQGYPGTFTYTPTYTGFSVAPGTMKFSIIGNMCIVETECSGTSNASTFTFTVPVAATGTDAWAVRGKNSGTELTAPSMVYLPASATAQVYRSFQIGGTTWTASGAKGIYGGQILYLF